MTVSVQSEWTGKTLFALAPLYKVLSERAELLGLGFRVYSLGSFHKTLSLLGLFFLFASPVGTLKGQTGQQLVCILAFTFIHLAYALIQSDLRVFGTHTYDGDGCHAGCSSGPPGTTGGSVSRPKTLPTRSTEGVGIEPRMTVLPTELQSPIPCILTLICGEFADFYSIKHAFSTFPLGKW